MDHGRPRAWHVGAGRLEAALEARLERARLLGGSPSIRAALQGDLLRRLPSLREAPWYSMGLAEAVLLCEMTDAEALLRARELADEGMRAHPGSLGAGRCEAIARVIEANTADPEISLALEGDVRSARLRVRHRLPARLEVIALRPAKGGPAVYGPWTLGPLRLLPSPGAPWPNPAPMEGTVLKKWTLSVPSVGGRAVTPRPLPFDRASSLPLDVPYRESVLPLGEVPAGTVLVTRIARGGLPVLMNLDEPGLEVVAVDDGTTRLVLVLDRKTGAGIPGAEIRVTGGTGQRRERVAGRTDREGRLRIPLSTTPITTIRALHAGREASARVSARTAGPDAGALPLQADLVPSRRIVEPGAEVHFLIRVRERGRRGATRAAAGVDVTLELRRRLGADGPLATARITTAEDGCAGGVLRVPETVTTSGPVRPGVATELEVLASTAAGRLSWESEPGLTLVEAPADPREEPVLKVVPIGPPFPAGPERFEGRLSVSNRGIPSARLSWCLRGVETTRKPAPCPEYSFCSRQEESGILELASGETFTDAVGRFTIEADAPGRSRCGLTALLVETSDPRAPARASAFPDFPPRPRVGLAVESPRVASGPFELRVTRTVDGAPRPAVSLLRVYRASGPSGTEGIARFELSHDVEGVARLRLPALEPGRYELDVSSGLASGQPFAHAGTHVLVVADGFTPDRCTFAAVDPASRLRSEAPGGERDEDSMGHVFVGLEKPGRATIVIHSPAGSLRDLRVDGPGGRLIEAPEGSAVYTVFPESRGRPAEELRVPFRTERLRLTLPSAAARSSTGGDVDVEITGADGRPVKGVRVVARLTRREDSPGPLALAGDREDPSAFVREGSCPPQEEPSFANLLPPESARWKDIPSPDLSREFVAVHVLPVSRPWGCVGGLAWPPQPPRRPDLPGPSARRPSESNDTNTLRALARLIPAGAVPPRALPPRPPLSFRTDLRTDATGRARIALPRGRVEPLLLQVLAIGAGGVTGYIERDLPPGTSSRGATR